MTKFEEEFDKNVHVTSEVLTGRKICSANQAKALGHGWVSPEEHQARVNELIEAKEKYTKLLYENSSLKSQLQQQALPVVPEFVGNFLKGKSIFGIANGDIPDDVISWVQGKTCYVDLEKIISHLISIKVTGYTVEKPQLFYLKHIDMSRTDKEHDHYLIKTVEGGFKSSGFNHIEHYKNELPDYDDCFEFTQQEIDSMETGSYEQIEVVE